ncbi:hypothetical protein [Dokdonella immobilis]|uniref:hypothetical protein n=1 Tax=Dokdonella immobilis TaxID=578942 RepID=UPI0011146A77|nr:hypothetical protein [Dokdonella immobilis]
MSGGALGFEMVPPNATSGYAAAAHDFWNGLNVFGSSRKRPMLSVLLLAAFCAECALKSFLSRAGFDEDTLSRRPYGHDLDKLWTESAARGLGISPSSPDWLKILHEQNQAGDFHIRYCTRRHSTTSPGLHTLLDELKSLLDAIELVRINGLPSRSPE